MTRSAGVGRVEGACFYGSGSAAYSPPKVWAAQFRRPHYLPAYEGGKFLLKSLRGLCTGTFLEGMQCPYGLLILIRG